MRDQGRSGCPINLTLPTVPSSPRLPPPSALSAPPSLLDIPTAPSHSTTDSRGEERMDDRLIVGLDLPDAAAARALVAGLGDEIGFYKIGLGLLASGGLELARDLRARTSASFST